MTLKDPDRDARERLLIFAKEQGAHAADVIAMRAQNLDVSVRKGALEDAVRSESFGIGLRVFKGASHAYGSTADASDDGLRTLAAQVCAMADAVPPDDFSALADAALLARDIPDLDLYDPDAGGMDVKQLGDLARRAEDAALGVRGITNSDGAHAGQGVHWISLSATNGFSGCYAHSGTHLSLSMIAGKGDQMETDHAGAQATYAADMEDPAVVGIRAAERTVARVGARVGKTGRFPVLFDRRVASSLLRSLTRGVSGPRLAKGTSFLQDRLGAPICAPGITIIDDPLKKRGMRSNPFDGEGLAPSRKVIVENGILKELFLDLRSARRLNMAPTGHATRGLSSPPSPTPSNIWIAAGAQSRAAMIRDIGEGFLVTELMGASISLSTGDYSRGASGFWIEKGEIAYPVAEMTIAGNLKDMLLHMSPADDLEFRDGVDAPSLRVDGMTVATR